MGMLKLLEKLLESSVRRPDLMKTSWRVWISMISDSSGEMDAVLKWSWPDEQPTLQGCIMQCISAQSAARAVLQSTVGRSNAR